MYDQSKVDELENAEELTGKDQKKLEAYQANKPVYDAIVATLKAAVSEQIYNCPAEFTPVLSKALSAVTADKKLLEKIADGLSVMDKKAEIQRDRKGSIIYDKETKDTEQVKWEENIEDYMAREVLPHIPDAAAFFEENLGAKKPVIKTGAEIPFTRYFYKYQPSTANWELKKIKYCLQERIEKNNPIRTTEILSLTAKQGVIPYEQKEGGGNKPKEDVSAYRLAYPGDIVMNSMNILSGSVGLSEYFGCVSPVYYMLRPWNAKEDVRYYNYIFQTTMFQRSLFGLGNGILIKESGNGKLNTIRMRIPMDKFGGLFIPVAPIDEQHRIADFLDAKCAEIDALTADIQTQIDTLEQHKRSVITETVTKGLNPDAKMKDSGIQWIGNMPAHWDVIRGKYILRYMQKPVREDDGVITCFRDGEVTLRSNRREDGFTLSDKEIGYQGIDVGDLVVHGMDGFAGSIGISDSRGKASPVLNVLDTDQCKRYIMYYLRSMAYSDVFLALATGIRVRSCDLRWNKLAELSYPVPPLDEQNAIVKHIDSVLSKADAVIADKKAQLATLDEYKKSLIFEYVTGKKEVPAP